MFRKMFKDLISSSHDAIEVEGHDHMGSSEDPFHGEVDEVDFMDIDNTPIHHDKDREEGNVKIGERTFLGDGHHGSPRHLAKLAMNSLAIVSEFGKPTFFLTLTCNHMWPEVQCRLFPGQSTFDREDVINQVGYTLNNLIYLLIRFSSQD